MEQTYDKRCEKMCDLLETLANTMDDISKLWEKDNELDNIMMKKYPKYFYSFREMALDARGWADDTIELLQKEKAISMVLSAIRNIENEMTFKGMDNKQLDSLIDEGIETYKKLKKNNEW